MAGLSNKMSTVLIIQHFLVLCWNNRACKEEGPIGIWYKV